MTAEEAILSDKEIQGGTPCFRGTRVPVKSLFSAVLHGRTVDYFLAQFPSVSRDQVEAVLRDASDMLTARASPSHAA